MRALLLLGLAACAGAEAMPMTPSVKATTTESIAQDMGVMPGESMAFDITIAGILAGEAQLAVGEVTMVDQHRHVMMHSRAATAGAAAMIKHVVDEATTEIDLDTGKPVRFSTLIENGDKRTTAEGTFVGKKIDVTYRREDDNNTPRRMQLDFGAQNVDVMDAHAAMASVRGWRAAIGTTRTVYVLGGKRLWKVDLTFGGNETIGTALGNRAVVKLAGVAYRAHNSLRIEPGTPSRVFTVYLSDDADRVPIKVIGQTELGDVTMDLTDYTRN